MRKLGITMLVILLFLTFWLNLIFTNIDNATEISYYPDFLELVSSNKADNKTENKIEEVLLEEDTIRARLTDGKIIKTYKPNNENISELLIENEIPFTVKPEPKPVNYSPIVFLALIGMIFFGFNQIKNKSTNLGEARVPVSNNVSNITFEQVAGIDEEKFELQEIVEYLRNPQKFSRLGARVPRGVLLAGPAGTGKTLLAKAVAGEAEVPFFSTSGSSFAEMFVGVGPSRVRSLFAAAKKNSPSIIFIDEIDAIGRKRGTSANNDERENTLNQLLVEMDGFGTDQGVIVIAATNRPDILDPALLRPGRFDRQIFVGPPDINGRESILKVHSKDKPLDKNIDLRLIAKQTPGFTGADLENLINEAALLALRKNKNKISMDDLEEAIEKVIAGTEKPNRLNEKEKRITAYHEAGHALVGYLLENKVHKVSIIPRGMAGGYTLILPEENSYLSKTQLLNKIRTLLAGRAAEEIIFNEITTGAQNDLERSTEIAKQMITKYGMNNLGPISFTEDNMLIKPFSERTAQLIDQEIQDTINTCYKEVKDLLIKNKSKLNSLARTLIEKETLNSDEIDRILKPSVQSSMIS